MADGFFLPRRVSTPANQRSQDPRTRALTDWRAARAYVLLGEPGAGKSAAFAHEACAMGGQFINARQLADAVPDKPDKPIFIDGLDEAQLRSSRASDALGAVAQWIRKHRPRQLRVACREADWFGASDLDRLACALGGAAVAVLHLEPLDADEAVRLLQAEGVEHPQAFADAVERHGLGVLLGNPMMVRLLATTLRAHPRQADVVTLEGLTRTSLYEQACKQLARETNTAHRDASPLLPGQFDTVLDDAGALCAVLLLSGRQALRLHGGDALDAADEVDIRGLPTPFQLGRADLALKSRIFATSDGRSTPVHRTVAEFLAARDLARRVSDGQLPLDRVLALLLGRDGRPVEAMRGLLAWLAVALHGEPRRRLLTLDPLGFIVNGDAAALTGEERLHVLEALAAATRDNPWLRSNQWATHPFGPLAKADLEAKFTELLGRDDRSRAHQALIDCVLDALSHGDPMPGLLPHLATWIEDPRAYMGNRKTAVSAWLHNSPPDGRAEQVVHWLETLLRDELADPDDQLLGVLLTAAYPNIVGPSQVLRYFRPRAHRRLIGSFNAFWHWQIVKATPPKQFRDLAGAWLTTFPNGVPYEFHDDAMPLAAKVLEGALGHEGDGASIEEVHAWLHILDGPDGANWIRGHESAQLRAWLAARPKLTADLIVHGLASARRGVDGEREFWKIEHRLPASAPLAELAPGVMRLAAETADEELCRWIVARIATAVIDRRPSESPTPDEISRWVEVLAMRFRDAAAWLEQAWSWPVNDWRGRRYRSTQHFQHEQLQSAAERKAKYAEILLTNAASTCPLGALQQIAMAHEGLLAEFKEDNAGARVGALVGGAKAAAAAMKALDATLARGDLPTPTQIFDAHFKGKSWTLQLPALVAASRAAALDEDVWQRWTPDAQQRLVAFWLTRGMGEEPAWFARMARKVPERVAPLLVEFARRKLRSTSAENVTGLFPLAADDERAGLRSRVIPALIETLPSRLKPAAHNELRRVLLPAVRRLPAVEVQRLVKARLAVQSMDSNQRIAWLGEALHFDALAIEALVRFVGRNPARVAALGDTLQNLHEARLPLGQRRVQVLQRLIEALGPMTPHVPDWPGGLIDATKQREGTVQTLIALLAGDPSDDAGLALEHLAAADNLRSWRDLLRYRQQAQRELRREATFVAPNPAQVAHTLASGAPASIGDLLALTAAHLAELEQELRHHPTLLMREFWRTDAKGQSQPLDENFCRDKMVDRLKLRLSALGLDTEARAAGDKRVDLRVSATLDGGHRVALPIEVKKDDHDLVWTAWRDQLARLYTADPTADGHGIYLVLWFGQRTRRSPEGERPASARQMQAMLEERLATDDRPRLKIVVMDLSWRAEVSKTLVPGAPRRRNAARPDAKLTPPTSPPANPRRPPTPARGGRR